MAASCSRDQKKELVNILLDSVYYLDLGLAERNRLLCLLMGSHSGAAMDREGDQARADAPSSPL